MSSTRFASPTFSAWLVIVLPAVASRAADGPVSVSVDKADPPKELSEPIRSALDPTAVRLVARGNPSLNSGSPRISRWLRSRRRRA